MRKALVICCLLLSACATSGNKFEMSEVDSMQSGVTTIQEAQARLGKPTSVSNMANGSTLLQWMFIEASAFHSTGRHVAVLFDSNGKMIRITHKFSQ